MLAIGKKWYFLVAAALIAAIAALPFLLSAPPVLNLLLSAINLRLPGTLSMRSLSLGWRQGLVCNKVVYEDRDKRFTVLFDRLSNSQGLLKLAVSPKNLGVFTVDDPVLIYTMQPPAPQPEAAPAGKNQAFQEQLQPSGPQSSAEQDDKQSPPVWNTMLARVVINNGEVQTGRHGDRLHLLAKSLHVDTELSRGTLNFTVHLQSGDKQGSIGVKGFLNLPAFPRDFADTTVSQTELAISKFPLHDFLDLLQDPGEAITGTGLLSSFVTLKTVGIKDINLNGEIALDALRLSGGPLGSQPTAIDNIHCLFEGARKDGKEWRINSFNLQSAPLRLSANGFLADSGLEIEGKGTVSLPVLTQQVPLLLSSQPGASIRSGTTDLHFHFLRGDKITSLSSTIAVKDFSGVAKNHAFSWNKILVELDGQKNDQTILIRNLAVESPFLNASGKGDLQSFELTGSADLHQSLAEINKIIPLGWSGNGNTTFLITSRETGKDIYTLQSSLQADDFSLEKADKTVVGKSSLSLQGRVVAPLAFFTEQKGESELTANFSAWPGEAGLRCPELRWSNNALAADYRLTTQLSLDRMTSLLRSLEVFTTDQALSGNLALTSEGAIADGRLGLEELDVLINGFTYSSADLAITEKQVRLQALPSAPAAVGVINITPPVTYSSRREIALENILPASDNRPVRLQPQGKNRSKIDLHGVLTLHDLLFSADTGTVRCDDLVLIDWSHPADGLTAKVRVTGDLSKITNLLQQNRKMAPDLALAGNLDASLLGDIPPFSQPDASLSLHLEQLDVTKAKQQFFTKEEAIARVRMVSDQGSGETRFPAINLISAPLSLTASGTLAPESGTKVLRLAGNFQPDLEKIAPILEILSGKKITMQGSSQHPFSLVLPLQENTAGEQAISRAELSSEFSADLLGYQGVDLRSLTMPVSLKNGILQSDISGRLNDGQLTFKPKVTFAPEPARLTTDPANQRILTDVRLEKPLATNVLGSIHPLFGLLTEAEGTIDLQLDSLDWPLPAENSKERKFTAILDVSKLTLDSSPFLRSILEPFSLQNEPLHLEENQLTCKAANDRISCSPIRITAADSTMTLSGSVGFDNSLDYLLEIPVTKKLVGTEGYRVLEGTTIKVPLRGTTDKPVYDQKMIRDALSNLLGQAAKKAVTNELEKALPGLLDKFLKTPDKNN